MKGLLTISTLWREEESSQESCPAPAGVKKLSITLTPNMEAAKYVPSLLCMPNYSLMA